MSMVDHFVERMNCFRVIFGEPKITFPLNADEIEEIYSAIMIQSEPENLSCDGELSPQETSARYQYLRAVLKQMNILTGENRSMN